MRSALPRGLGLSLLALVALGCGGGGGGADASAQPEPDVAGTPGDEGTGDPGTPPEGSQGECTGDHGVSATGDYVIQGPSAVLTVNHLDVVSVTATHKVDIDVADQCLSSIEIVLSTLFEGAPACRLTLRGDASSDDDASKIVLVGTFEADSFCQGFPDVDEGTYTGYAGTAEVDASFLGAGNHICVQAQVSIDLHGSLTKAGDDTRLIVFDSTDFEISGDISSSGATHHPCMEGYSGRAPTLVCSSHANQACACADGAQGVQTCLADGSGWTTCTCDDTSTNPVDDCLKDPPAGWACNPYCQTGCPAGQGCTYIETAGGCFPTGFGDMGQLCSGTSCKAGHACVQFDGGEVGSDEVPICRRFCITDSDCGPDRKCDLTVNGLFTVCSDPTLPDPDACDSNPCKNGGTCFEVDDGYICECPEGYVGETCELDCAKPAPGGWACNPYCQLDCPNGWGCTFGYDLPPPSIGGCYPFARCEPTGMSDMGQACSTSAACQAGHACLPLEGNWTCRRFCITDADCGEERTCSLEADPDEEGLLQAVTLCSDPAPACVPDCVDKECGDTCGGVSCGTCADTEFCYAGECLDVNLDPPPCASP